MDISVTSLSQIQASAVCAAILIQSTTRAVALVAQIAAVELAVAKQRLVQAEARGRALELVRQVALFGLTRESIKLLIILPERKERERNESE